jgi:hypothetical protein
MMNYLYLFYLRVVLCPVTRFGLLFFYYCALTLCLKWIILGGGVVIIAHAATDNQGRDLDLSIVPPEPIRPPFDLNETPQPEQGNGIMTQQGPYVPPAPAGPSNSATGEQVEAAVVTPNIEETLLLNKVEPLVNRFTQLKNEYDHDPAGYIKLSYLEVNSIESFKPNLLEDLSSADNAADDFLKLKEMELRYSEKEFQLKKLIAQMLEATRPKKIKAKFLFQDPEEIGAKIHEYLVFKGIIYQPSEKGIKRLLAELGYLSETSLGRRSPIFLEILQYFSGKKELSDFLSRSGLPDLNA